MSKMFVHYSGTVDAFSKLSNITDYNNKIVFIKGGADGTGAAIYTHGNYYANLNDALAGLKYISGVKAGDTIAKAQGPNGIIEFSADDPTTVSVEVESTGVTIGLTADFKKSVSDNTTAIAANTKAISDEASARDTAITIAKNELTTEINKKADITTVTGIDDKVKTIEGDYLKAADITGKLDTSVYNKKIAELTEADSNNLQSAKDYVDDEIAKLNSSTIAAQVEANKTAIATLNGTGTGSVSKQVADAIAGVINNAPEDFDTLKEVADWIANDTTGAAKMQADIATLKGSDTTTGSVAKTVKDAIAALDVTDTAVANKYVSAVSETDGKITVTRADLPTYTLTTGTANGTVKFNGTAVSVYGLKSAAYTEVSAYATAAQGAKADAAAPQATTYTKTEVDDMWAWEEL